MTKIITEEARLKRNEYHRKHYANNKEIYKEVNKRNVEKNGANWKVPRVPRKILNENEKAQLKKEWQQTYYIKNRSKRLEYQAQWLEQNREIKKEYLKNYRKTKKDGK